MGAKSSCQLRRVQAGQGWVGLVGVGMQMTEPQLRQNQMRDLPLIVAAVGRSFIRPLGTILAISQTGGSRGALHVCRLDSRRA